MNPKIAAVAGAPDAANGLVVGCSAYASTPEDSASSD
jgi:hypothetical protein